MACADLAILGQKLTFTLNIKDSNGTPVDADSAPSYSVYEDETGTAILSGTMTLLDDAGTTGFYSEQLDITSANGFERYKSYSIRSTATISGTDYTHVDSFLCLGGSDTFTATTGALTTYANLISYADIAEGTDETLLTALINRATSAIQKYCDRTFISASYCEFHDGDGTTDILVDEYPIISVEMLAVGRIDAVALKNTSADAYNAYVQVDSTDMKLIVSGGTNAGTSTLTLGDYSTLNALITAITALDKGWSASLQTSIYSNWGPSELYPIDGAGCLSNSTVGQSNIAYLQIPNAPEYNYRVQKETGIITRNLSFPKGIQNIMVKYAAGYETTPADLEQICIDLVLNWYYARKREKGLLKERIGDYSYEVQANTKGMPNDIKNRLVSWQKKPL